MASLLQVPINVVLAITVLAGFISYLFLQYGLYTFLDTCFKLVSITIGAQYILTFVNYESAGLLRITLCLYSVFTYCLFHHMAALSPESSEDEATEAFQSPRSVRSLECS